MSIDYEKLYKKYKTKYINLKSQIGGSDEEQIRADLNLELGEQFEFVRSMDSRGRGGSIYIIKNDSGVEYILKKVNREEDGLREARNQNIASILHIAPKVIHTWKNSSNNVYIIMEKYSKELKASLLITKDFNQTILDRIIEVFRILHENRILHNDASSSNWMFNNDDYSDLVLIDFGDSEIKDSDITVLEKNSEMSFLYSSLKYSALIPEAKLSEFKNFIERLA